MPLDFAITALVTLFVVVDPVGLAPTFLAVTEGLPRRARRDVAVRAILGDLLLHALGISLSAFRIAGGLLLFAIAFEMVLGVRMRREGQAAEEAVEEHVRNIAAFPLAIPLMAGPGAITATVLLAGRAFGHMLLVGLLLAVVVFVSLSCLVAFLLAGRLSRLLGLTGNIVLSRLLGVLLAALAVQYVVDGIRAVLTG
jgi:multiple antibiotic resistance protein